MNDDRPDFSDTDLSAWLDGALDPTAGERLEAWLREHPAAAAAHVQRWLGARAEFIKA